MTIEAQKSSSSKKCLHRSQNGTPCTFDAAEGSSYCSQHRPAESGQGSGGGFGKSEVLYTKVDKPNRNW
jgi:hypothetical protein